MEAKTSRWEAGDGQRTAAGTHRTRIAPTSVTQGLVPVVAIRLCPVDAGKRR